MIPPYTTTVVGAHSVPGWYETLERHVTDGSLAPAEMQDAQFRATQAAIADQEAAGIDVITGGEMHRRTNNRNAPPNAMLNHFWAKIPGFSHELRPKSITPKDPQVTHPAAACVGPVQYADLGLVAEFETVSAFARQEVKVTMTGPHLLAKVSWDEFYGDVGRLMHDLAKVLNANFRQLQDAGCEHVQIDEPYFAAVERDEVEVAVEAINEAFEGITMTKWVHVCQGNYAVGPEYDGQIGHRYFDFGEYPADLIVKIDCDVLMIEGDMASRYEGKLGNLQLAVGAVDVQDTDVETPEIVAERINRIGWLPPEQTLITSSCGMNHLPRQVAFGKLRAMHDAKAILLRQAESDGTIRPNG